MKSTLFIALILTIGFSSLAQNEDDALRYSYQFFGGSARNIATAGSFGAVGGDYSIVSSNPAGLARFKKHNFSLSTIFESPKATADFYGITTKASETYFKIGNVSYVKAYNLDPNTFGNWYGVQLGMGYNRIRSYAEDIHYTGTSTGSILHSFINQANGTSPDNIYDVFPFDAGLAYDTYAIDPEPGNMYSTQFHGTALHDRTIHRKGGLGEYNFTLSGNYANKLFVGGALNFTRLKYSDHYEHKETYTDASMVWINSTRYLYDLDITGWGIGARVGAIYLPVDWLRVGLSVQTPTRFNLSDTWSANMYTDTQDGLKYVSEENVPYGSYKYRLQTPMRANFSLGLIYKKLGSFGLDVEYVDYAGASLSSKKYAESPYLFTTENAQIENIYRSAINIKSGVEIRVTGQFYLRAGYANYQSAFKQGKGNHLYATQFFTGGAGYSWGKFYLDAALSVRSNAADYYAYDPTILGSNIGIKYANTAFTMTAGFRFE